MTTLLTYLIFFVAISDSKRDMSVAMISVNPKSTLYRLFASASSSPGVFGLLIFLWSSWVGWGGVVIVGGVGGWIEQHRVGK